MTLTFEPFDGRTFNLIPIVDEDDGNKVVGQIKSKQITPGIDVSLYDGRYKRLASTYEECLGFVKGVENVLNYVSKPKAKPVYRRF